MSRPANVPALPREAISAVSGDPTADKASIPHLSSSSHAGYTVAPPPASGLSALRQFTDIVSVAVVAAARSRDAKGKEVVFYEVAAASTTHSWVVHKRFSDFHEFHVVNKEQLCLDHGKFVVLPEFPSRVHIGSLSDASIEKRRVGLSTYLAVLLEKMKRAEYDVRAASVDGTAAAPESQNGHARNEARLLAALQHVVAFLRSNSVSSIAAADGDLLLHSPLSARHLNGASNRNISGADVPVSADPSLVLTPSAYNRDQVIATPRTQPSDDVPPLRIARYGDAAFVAMVFVPGVPSRDLYVIANPEQPRHVIVGGRWNCYTAASAGNATLEKLLLSNAAANGVTNREAALAALHQMDSYYDTLPVGEFEITFEVPSPFVKDVWFSEYKDGVFHVIWTPVVSSSAATTA